MTICYVIKKISKLYHFLLSTQDMAYYDLNIISNLFYFTNNNHQTKGLVEAHKNITILYRNETHKRIFK